MEQSKVIDTTETYQVCISIIMHRCLRPLVTEGVYASRRPSSSIYINSLGPRPRLTRRPRGSPRLQLTCPYVPAYNATADSVVINFNVTVVIINSAVDNFWLNISGEIYPVYFYIILLSLKKQLLWLASSPMQDKLYH